MESNLIYDFRSMIEFKVLGACLELKVSGSFVRALGFNAQEGNWSSKKITYSR